MLKQRVVTAVLLGAAFLAAVLWLPAAAFLASMAVVIVLGAWEWARLCGWQDRRIRAGYAAVVLLALVPLQAQDAEQRRLLLLAGCLWWIYAYFLIRRYPAVGTAWQRPWLPAVAGLLVLLPGWSAIVALRSAGQHEALILLLIALVAAADIGAYFSGKAFGRRKLAPAVSPNKTWEGLAGGLLLSSFTALGFVWLSGAVGPPGPLLFTKVLLVALSIAIVSVVGDLFESMLKRMAGVKDSGTLLPGHGGVLDRIDSVSAALPLFAITLNWLGAA